uniref:Seminal fluid protein HACP016 n=1 Tax=Panagrellus redivivus TaxID=6233 RepID=A0A7E4VK53_PANRE
MGIPPFPKLILPVILFLTFASNVFINAQIDEIVPLRKSTPVKQVYVRNGRRHVVDVNKYSPEIDSDYDTDEFAVVSIEDSPDEKSPNVEEKRVWWLLNRKMDAIVAKLANLQPLLGQKHQAAPIS